MGVNIVDSHGRADKYVWEQGDRSSDNEPCPCFANIFDRSMMKGGSMIRVPQCIQHHREGGQGIWGLCYLDCAIGRDP